MVTSLIQPSYQNNFFTPQRGGIPANPNLWKGLIGAWPTSLGVTGINTLYDISGYNNHGTMNSMTIDAWGVGKNGHTLGYDGSNDNVLVVDSPILRPAKVTIAAWVKADASQPDGTSIIVDKYSFANSDGFHLAIESNGFSKIDVWGAGGEVIVTNGTDIRGDGIMHLIVGTYDGNNTTDGTRIYVDGIEEANGIGRGDIQYDVTPFDLTIADNNAAQGRFRWAGEIGDVYLWNRALLPSEIMQLYIDPSALPRIRSLILGKAPVVGGRIMSSLVNAGGLAGYGGIAGKGGGLAG